MDTLASLPDTLLDWAGSLLHAAFDVLDDVLDACDNAIFRIMESIF